MEHMLENPNTEFDALLEALKEGRRADAEVHAEDINVHLEHGGREPRRSAEVELSQALVEADLADGECPMVEELISRLRGEEI